MLAGRASLPLREAVLVMTMVNHPRLIAAHLDDFADIVLAAPELDRLRGAVLEIASRDGGEVDAEALAKALAEGPLAPLVARLRDQIAATGHWPAGPAAADADAEEGWRQALTLHRRTRTLHRELKDAEAVLAAEWSEANLARLRDIQTELATSDGAEALIEGFGQSSGRQARVF
jgi:DNA primase